MEKNIEGESNENNDLKKSSLKVNDKLNNTANSLKETAKSVFQTVQKSGEVYSELMDRTTRLVETKRDIELIKAKTEIELSRIDKSHETNMALIKNEYGKQAKAMSIAENVVAKGLEDDDLNKIALGLQNVTGIANHNPFENFQKNLDNDLKELNRGMDDDDYIIEI